MAAAAEPAPSARSQTSAQGGSPGLTHATNRRAAGPAQKPRSLLDSNPEAERILAAWIDELTSIRVLDPACGSGNFLYLALRRMLDLWLEAQRFAAEQNISIVLPKMVSPAQLYGIETEFYAHELASIVVWIGFLQWKYEHGVAEDREPILEKLSNIEHADAILRYDEVSRLPILSLKHADRLDLVPGFAQWLERAGRELIQDSDIIVPVPLHRFRLWRRRYNQAAELARALSRRTGLPLDTGALIRSRSTPSQGAMASARARRRNVLGAFKVAERARIDGRRVLLVDDVVTTGATAEAASRALKRAGAVKVRILALARVVRATEMPI